LLALSVALHVGYKGFLKGFHRRGGLSQVDPVARGIAPLLVAVLAALAGGFTGCNWPGSRWCRPSC
jgi:hypothetical protein